MTMAMDLLNIVCLCFFLLGVAYVISICWGKESEKRKPRVIRGSRAVWRSRNGMQNIAPYRRSLSPNDEEVDSGDQEPPFVWNFDSPSDTAGSSAPPDDSDLCWCRSDPGTTWLMSIFFYTGGRKLKFPTSNDCKGRIKDEHGNWLEEETSTHSIKETIPCTINESENQQSVESMPIPMKSASEIIFTEETIPCTINGSENQQSVESMPIPMKSATEITFTETNGRRDEALLMTMIFLNSKFALQTQEPENNQPPEETNGRRDEALLMTMIFFNSKFALQTQEPENNQPPEETCGRRDKELLMTMIFFNPKFALQTQEPENNQPPEEDLKPDEDQGFEHNSYLKKGGDDSGPLSNDQIQSTEVRQEVLVDFRKYFRGFEPKYFPNTDRFRIMDTIYEEVP